MAEVCATEEVIEVVGLDICLIPQVLERFYLKHILTEDNIYIEMFSFSKQSTHIRRSERVWHDCMFMIKLNEKSLFNPHICYTDIHMFTV